MLNNQMLDEAFSPSAPIVKKDFFSGRVRQIIDVLEAINERGQHVIVYGDRGVGKTSLSNIIQQDVEGIFAIKVTCNRTENFSQLWEKAFHRVRFEQTKHGLGFKPTIYKEIVQLDLFLPNPQNVNTLDVQCVLEKVSIPLLFIFDEFDSVADKEARVRMADTLKALSDNAPLVTIMLVGIAKNVGQLIGDHPSIQRCLSQVKLPRMSSTELGEIIDRGLKHLGMSAHEDTRGKMIEFSSGFPHFTHLIAKFAAKNALANDRYVIMPEDLEQSISMALEKVDESIRLAYQRATMSSKENTKFKVVLWACSLCKEDENGLFDMSDIVDCYSQITNQVTTGNSLNYNVGTFCSEERGTPLERVNIGSRKAYRFTNPLLKAYSRLTFLSMNGGIKSY